MLKKKPIMQTPSQNNMVRTAIACPNTPREVGDGMETEKQEIMMLTTLVPTHIIESRTSSGYSTPILPASPRSHEKRLSVQVPLSQRSDEANSHRDSIPSPTPSDPSLMKWDRFLMEEKKALKDHLRIQVQVNQELKRLLVASIGEDMAFHYERIATEKAQIEIENEELKKNLLAQEEETERLNISCDVWRSKFLAGRVQCEELQDTLIPAQRRQREMDTAVRALIQEHRLRSEHLEEMFDTLQHLHDALQWGRKSISTAGLSKKDGPKDQIDVECLKLSHTISSRLLGSKKPAESRTAGYKKYLTSWNKMTLKTPTSSLVDYEVKPTMAEKYVTQLLQEPCSRYETTNTTAFHKVVTRRQQSGTVTGRFHPNAKHDNLTLACCSRCSGDIHVV